LKPSKIRILWIIHNIRRVHVATTVTATEFQKNIGRWMDHALREPVTITRHGRSILVVQSVTNMTAPPLAEPAAPARPADESIDRARYVQTMQHQLRGDPRSSVSLVNELLARRRGAKGDGR